LFGTLSLLLAKLHVEFQAARPTFAWAGAKITGGGALEIA